MNLEKSREIKIGTEKDIVRERDKRRERENEMKEWD